MHKLAQTMVLTSQGIPFLHAGTEFLRTKKGVENSFSSPDSINEIDWSRKLKYQKVNDYFRQIINLRRSHPAFRMATTDLIQKNLTFVEPKAYDGSAWYTSENTVMYTLNGAAVGDSWKRILVIYNGNTEGSRFQIPSVGQTWRDRWASLRLFTPRFVNGLPGLRFPDGDQRSPDVDAAARTVLAALTIMGDRLAFSDSTLFLRSGCDLSLVSESAQWVGRGEPISVPLPSPGDAIALFKQAVGHAASLGLEFAEPVLLRPKANLHALLALSFSTPAQED